jgi:hypothetical protein
MLDARMSRLGRIPRTKIGIVIASETNPLTEVSLRGSRATEAIARLSLSKAHH